MSSPHLNVAASTPDPWFPPTLCNPCRAQVRIKFMQRVLVPRLPAEKMKNALKVRGDLFVEKCRNKVGRALSEGWGAGLTNPYTSTCTYTYTCTCTLHIQPALCTYTYT